MGKIEGQFSLPLGDTAQPEKIREAVEKVGEQEPDPNGDIPLMETPELISLVDGLRISVPAARRTGDDEAEALHVRLTRAEKELASRPDR